MTSLRALFLILLLWLAGLGAAAQFAKLAVPFSTVRLHYPDAGAEIGWLLTLISALGAILGMTAGVLVARIGLGRTVVFALLLGGGISLWQASLPALSVMLLSRVIEGMSHLCLVVAAPTLIAQISPDRWRGASMTLWSTFFGVTFALMALFGLPLVEAWGLDGLLTLHGGYMLGLAAILWFFLSQLPSLPTATLPKLSLPYVLRQHVTAYRSPRLAAPAIGWLFYTMTFVALLAVLPEQLPADSRAQTLAVMPIASIAVALVLVSSLLVIFSAVTIVVVGYLLAAGVVLLFFIGVPLTPLCIALFAALGLVQGASFAAVPELNASGQDRALANGAIAQMGNLGNLFGTPVLLAVLGYGGDGAMLIGVAGLYAVGATAHVMMGLARKRAARLA